MMVITSCEPLTSGVRRGEGNPPLLTRNETKKRKGIKGEKEGEREKERKKTLREGKRKKKEKKKRN